MTVSRPRPVFAFAGPPGAGKSALLAALAGRYPAASVIAFDAYERMTHRHPAEISRWLDAGAPADGIDAPGLAEALDALRIPAAPVGAGTARSDGHRRPVLFEMPFGRRFAPTAGAIDRLVWLDVPLDIALARHLLGVLQHTDGSVDAEAKLAWLSGYLTSYTTMVRRALIMQADTVAGGADFWLDATAPFDELVAAAARVIEGGGDD